MDEVDKVDEVISELLERMKAPDMARKSFEDLAARVRIVQALAKK